jgi:hypothetical protein
MFTTAAEADYSHLLVTTLVKPLVGGALKIIDKNGNPL